jgi:uncharacterized protein involved in exopolysaccharide biosynthesis
MTEARGPQATGDPGGKPEEGVSLLWFAAVLLRERRVILVCAAVGIVVSVAIALLRQRTYTTNFSFLPQAAQDQSRAGLASLAGQFGLNLGSLGGAPPPPQLYADLLLTREVLGPIARDSFPVDADGAMRVPLAAFLKVGAGAPQVVADKTLRALRRNVIATSVATSTTGMVTVNVRTTSRYVSLAIGQRLLDGLNHFNVVTRQSQAREERRFTEARLADARASLRAAEDDLQHFLQTNRESESPELLFRKDRLQREVTLRQALVTSLAQRYEENRIQEVRDTPVITVIDAPALAARPDARLAVLIVILGTAAAVFVGVLIVTIRDAWARESTSGRSPGLALLASEWKRIHGAAAS